MFANTSSATSRLLQRRDFYCPEPLVYSDHSDNDDYYTLWALESQGCALPCPSLTYTSEEWKLVVNVLLVLSCGCFLAVIASSLILSTDMKKFYVKIMFTSGFFCTSIIIICFFIINYDNDVICQGEAHFYRRAPFCVFQAASLIFFFIWIQIWGIFLSLETYFFFLAKGRQKTIQWCRQYYTRIAFFSSAVLTSIPLACNNLGFDPYANLPVCLFLFHDNRNFFWFGLYFPFLILNLICSIITISSIKRINQIFVTTKEMKNIRNASTTHSSRSKSKQTFTRESSISEFSGSGFDSSILNSSLVSKVTKQCL
jgi:hypothetical protein